MRLTEIFMRQSFCSIQSGAALWFDITISFDAQYIPPSLYYLLHSVGLLVWVFVYFHRNYMDFHKTWYKDVVRIYCFIFISFSLTLQDRVFNISPGILMKTNQEHLGNWYLRVREMYCSFLNYKNKRTVCAPLSAILVWNHAVGHLIQFVISFNYNNSCDDGNRFVITSNWNYSKPWKEITPTMSEKKIISRYVTFTVNI